MFERGLFRTLVAFIESIDPALVFYPESYHNSGSALLENFTAGRYIGLPMLQMYGMTVIPGCGGDKTEDVVYPKMRRWLR